MPDLNLNSLPRRATGRAALSRVLNHSILSAGFEDGLPRRRLAGGERKAELIY